MESPRSTPNPGPASPLSYERNCAESIPGVGRFGKYLVVRRGCDLSKYCLICGRPSTGKPIRKGLFDGSSLGSSSGHSGRGGGIIILVIQLLLFIVWLFLLIGEWVESRRRFVIFGFCQDHLRRRRAFTRIAWLVFIVGIAALVLGIRRAASHRGPNSGMELFLQLGGCIGGPLLCILAAVIRAYAPGVSLSSEKVGYLWLTGAAEPFLRGQTEIPSTHPSLQPAATKKKKK